MTPTRPSLIARLFNSAAVIEAAEMLTSVPYFCFPFGSYSIVNRYTMP
jgi:hypothetical protein